MHDGVPAIQRLPPEVLALIFLHAVPASPCFGTSAGIHPLPVITSTCSQWRRLAIELRTLWAHVDIDADDSNNERTLHLLERTQLWIQRARGVPLHFHFLTNFGAEAHRADQLMPVLLSHAASIASLTFPRGVNIYFIKSLFAFWQNQAEYTLLETLVLRGGFASEDSLSWPTTLQGFANLQLLDLYRPTSPTVENLVNMISGSPRLHTLRLRNILISVSASEFARVKSPSLPFLRLLEITGLNSSFLLFLLAKLLPGSLALNLRLQTLQPSFATRVVLSFFDRSNITSLDYPEIMYPFTARDAAAPPVQWFSHLPQLRILFVSCAGDEGAQLDGLTTLIDGNMTALAPKLHTLVLLDSCPNDQTRRRVKCVVEAYSLRRLIFRASSDLVGRLASGSSAESGVETFNEQNTELQDFKDWLGQRVDTVTFEPRRITPDSIEEWDTYVQGLMSSLDA
ncbi:hypothetical protein FS749_014177 [Ceratobasidium sp. UAMH 11750]|nr:hypothetical protein FS749_014177 [Ceratobasidium sp. UAMH 11750]